MKKTLLIFGAAGALGRGVTARMLEMGYDEYFLFDRHHPGISETVNVRVVYTGDLRDETEVEAAFARLKPSKDSLFFLFSTIGGYAGGKPFWEHSREEITRLFDMNFQINASLLRCFAALVKESAGGSACFTSAQTALTRDGGNTFYGASKAALSYLVETAAKDGRSINLSVNAIAPSVLLTPENLKWTADAGLPSGSLISPEETAAVIHSLFSNFHFTSGNIILLPYRMSAHF